jgi:GT2 family glycosyltransferase
MREDPGRMDVELSYCVANADQRQRLRYCLDAIARERATVPFAAEVIVLDNASRDGSAEAARAHPATSEVIALEAPRVRAASDAALLARARGRFCLLLDGDAELEPGATAALHDALRRDGRAGAAGATLVRADGTPRESAWRLGRAVRGGRGRVRRVGWAPATALLVRREAAERVGSFDGALEHPAAARDFCRRLRRDGWRVLYVPEARAVDHEP